MSPYSLRGNNGFTLMEVLIAIVIFSFGLLGIAGLQLKMQSSHLESYQRSQAVLILNDISTRMSANIAFSSDYVTGPSTYLGVGDGADGNCADAALDTVAKTDRCQWGELLKGAAETIGATQAGAMIGARGCIEQLIAEDATPGVCTAGIYRISVVWQGFNATVAPQQGLLCGKDLYGDEKLRRVITTTITAGLPRCS